MNTLLKLFLSLECKYNKLQLGVRISSIEVGKQKLRMSTTKLAKGNPSWSDSSLKNKGIQSVFHKALVSVQPSPAEEFQKQQ